MNKTQKISARLKSDLFFFIFLFFIILFSFSFLSPKVSSQLYSFKRQVVLNQFISNTKTNNKIDPQEYWKFREFYSPGYFTFSRMGIQSSLFKIAQKMIGIKYDEKEISLTFLNFSSSRLNSLDMLTNKVTLSEIINYNLNDNIIFRNKNSIIYKTDSKTIKIIFLMNNQDMKKANGFFYYDDKDKAITEGKNWFNITSLKTD